jgi:hypothetical protein
LQLPHTHVFMLLPRTMLGGGRCNAALRSVSLGIRSIHRNRSAKEINRHAD